jgi:hypothetical protein
MPRDDWAKARRRDIARRETWRQSQRGKHKKARAARQSWLSAIQAARTDSELSYIGRNIAARFRAGKLAEYRYLTLVEAGKRRRRQLEAQQQAMLTAQDSPQ